MSSVPHTLDDLAFLIAAALAWGKIGGLPAQNDDLARALRSAANDELLPEWARSLLHFGVDHYGLSCNELPELILSMYQHGYFSRVENCFGLSRRIDLSRSAIQEYCRRRHILLEDVKWLAQAFQARL